MLGELFRLLFWRCPRACVDSPKGTSCGCGCGGSCHGQGFCSCGLPAPEWARPGSREKDGKSVTKASELPAAAAQPLGQESPVSLAQVEAGDDPQESRVCVEVWTDESAIATLRRM